MKIGVMGTHGTGKTTVALNTAAMFKRWWPGRKVGLVAEVARSCPWPVNGGTTERSQAWIFHRQIIDEMEAAGRNQVLVCDRTVLDNLAYAERAGFTGLVKRCLPVALEWWGGYDAVLWIMPGGGAVAADGFRDTDREFQNDIQAIIGGWVLEYSLPVEACRAGDVTEPFMESVLGTR